MNGKQVKKLRKDANRQAVKMNQKMLLEIRNWPLRRRFMLALKIMWGR